MQFLYTCAAASSPASEHTQSGAIPEASVLERLERVARALADIDRNSNRPGAFDAAFRAFELICGSAGAEARVVAAAAPGPPPPPQHNTLDRVLEFIFYGLIRFTWDAELQARGCHALVAVAHALPHVSGLACWRLGVCTCLCTAMTAHPHISSVQLAGCLALAELGPDMSDSADTPRLLSLDRQCAVDASSAVRAAAAAFPEMETLQVAAGKALARLTAFSQDTARPVAPAPAAGPPPPTGPVQVPTSSVAPTVRTPRAAVDMAPQHALRDSAASTSSAAAEPGRGTEGRRAERPLAVDSSVGAPFLSAVSPTHAVAAVGPSSVETGTATASADAPNLSSSDGCGAAQAAQPIPPVSSGSNRV